MSDTMTIRRGPWRFVWDGGRLADVWHDEIPDHPVDTVQVGNYEWETGKHTHAGRRSLNAAADQWMRDSSADFSRDLGYL